MLKIVVILGCGVFPNKKWIEEWLLQATWGGRVQSEAEKGLLVLAGAWNSVWMLESCIWEMAFVCSATKFLPITVLTKDFVLTNTTIKIKNYIS